MKDFDVTIGNLTVNTSLIDEDVIRLRMGLNPNQQSHYESANEDYFKCRNAYLDGDLY